MPELPEVEHIVRALRRSVRGRRILAAETKLPRLLVGSSPVSFKRKLRGARIDGVNRRGKYILIELDNQQVLVVHLRMTGKFLCIGADQPLPPYPMLCFTWMTTGDWSSATCGSLAGCDCCPRKSCPRFRKSKRWRLNRSLMTSAWLISSKRFQSPVAA